MGEIFDESCAHPNRCVHAHTTVQASKSTSWCILMGVKAPASNPKILSQDQVKAWFALLFAHATVTGRMDAVLLEQYKLSFSAFEILCWLLETEPQSIRALSGQLVSVSPTRASRLVQDLIDAGHLQRGADQGDGRVSLISFTESGRHFARNGQAELRGGGQEVLRRSSR